MRCHAIIPARGGSKGLVKKNLKLLGDRPLIVHTIEHAIASKCTNVYVTTDCPEIVRVAEQAGAKIIQRPSELAADLSTTEETLQHAAENIVRIDGEVEAMAYLSCAQPFRKVEWIDICIDMVSTGGYDSAFVGYNTHKNYWVDNNDKFEPVWRLPYSSRQVRKNILEENTGSCCVTRSEFFLSGERIGTHNYILPVDGLNIDIHSECDMYLANKLHERYNR